MSIAEPVMENVARREAEHAISHTCLHTEGEAQHSSVTAAFLHPGKAMERYSSRFLRLEA